MPQAQAGQQLIVAAQIPSGIITSDMVATDTLVAADIAANSVGDSEIAAHTTTKITVPATLFTVASQAQGDIIYYNGTNWVRLAAGTSGQLLQTLGAGANPAWATGTVTYTVGQTTRAGNTASGDQTIAHGLGKTPLKVRITAWKAIGTNWTRFAQSVGIFKTGFGVVQYISDINDTAAADGAIVGNAQNSMINIYDNNTGGGVKSQTATIAIDATNITLTWTKTSTPSADNIYLLWEVEG